jgi:DNA primase
MRAAGRVLVVEGYMDVVALAQFGVDYSVATLGTATTPDHVSKLLHLADELVFSFDGDAAGRKAAWRALEVSLPHAPDSKPIRFLFLPEGEDPDTFVRRYGKEEFEKRIAQAKMLSEFLLDELRKQCDLGSSEGRSKFLSLAKPYLQKIGGPELRIQVAKEAARLGGEEGGEARLLDPVRVPAFTRRVKTNVDKTAKFDLEERLFVFVIAEPSLALQVDPQVLSPDREETKALETIVEALKRTSSPESVSYPMLLELLGESPHRQLIARAKAMLVMSLGLDEEAAAEEFPDTLAKLKSRIPAEEENLKKKVLKRIATPEEKLAYEERFKGKTTPN